MSYQVGEDGTIGDPVEKSAGAVIDCTSAVLVELLQPEHLEEQLTIDEAQ